MATTRSTKPAQAYKIQRVFPIRINSGGGDVPDLFVSPATTPVTTFDTLPEEPLDPEDIESLEVNKEPGEGEQQDTNHEEDHIFPDTPSVTTSQSLKTTLPSGGRFVSNTFSYATSDTTAPPSSASEVNNPNAEPDPAKSDQKVYKCEDEPIHIPGSIQGFGALIAIREDERGRFLVRMVSENSQSVTGLQPEALFELRCFTDLLIHSDKKDFTTRFRGLMNRDRGTRTNPDVFSLSLTSLLGAPLACFIAMHLVDESNLMICEFELKKDVFNPRHPPEEGLPEHPVEVIDSQATEEERLLSTKSKSKPLHAVQVARETARQIGSMELFHVLCEIQNQLASATTLPEIMDIIVGLVYELTSFHRVMVYQFDETAAGQVVSEIVDARASTDIYRGLHFPASDIPKQARDLYLINKIRVLYDRDQKTARLVCRTKDDAATPLDLKHSYLRAMSPIHIKYLENMGVRASMSISLTVDNKLWGLISCHSYGGGMRVSLPVRELCRALGDLASTNIEKLLYATRIKARKPLVSSPPKNSPSAYIAASSADLLNMFGADFGFLAIKGEARTIGKLFAYNEAIVLLQYVRKKACKEIFFTQSIKKDCPDIPLPPGSATIAGMLIIPLALSGSDFLIFFRKGQTMEVQWAGNPYEKKKSVGPYLQPRASFRRWSEHVSGRSREWTEDQVESAIVLSTLYGRFIEVWRQKEAIVQRNRMTRLLIRNAGHEVRTPLNSIINHLEVALEEVLDERARQHLIRSLQASKSLIFQINDLLNLTEAEDSEIFVHEDNVDLKAMIVEVIASLRESSARNGLVITIDDDANVPTIVRCDPSVLRQVISNLVANAIEHSSAVHVSVGLKHVNTTEANTLVEMYFQDNGRGMSEAELDRLFQEFEQVLDDEENQPGGVYEPADSKELVSLGLGLATTARFVRLNCGQISIASEIGKGTKVSVKVPFRKARPDFSKSAESDKENPLPTPPMYSPDSTIKKMQFPNFLERSHSLDTILPIRSPLGKMARGYNLGPGAESLASVAQAVSMTTGKNYEPTGGNYLFPSLGPSYARVNVLIAEDNPLNSRLLETRLTRRGHDVKVTVDGQGCADVFQAHPDVYDVILMDLQMPFVDGKAATKIIRAYEKANSPPVSAQVQLYGRVPIIAVSASLSELSCTDYIEAGFDGWILKPIDFTRLEAILAAIQDDGIRKNLIYPTSRWEDGGWFKFRADGSKF